MYDRLFKIFVWVFGCFQIGNAALHSLTYGLDGKTGWAVAWGVVTLLAAGVLGWGLRKINEEVNA